MTKSKQIVDLASMFGDDVKAGKKDKLDLTNRKFGVELCEVVKEGLQSPQNCLKEAYLGSNKLGLTGIRHLTAGMMHENNHLILLSLNGNSIGDDGAKELAKCLQSSNCKIQKLYLDGIGLKVKGAKTLAEALTHENNRVTDLNLRENKIGNEGSLAFSIAVQNHNCKLVGLDITKNDIDDEGMSPWINGIRFSRTLTFFSHDYGNKLTGLMKLKIRREIEMKNNDWYRIMLLLSAIPCVPRIAKNSPAKNLSIELIRMIGDTLSKVKQEQECTH